jgi:hypothetical protein
MACPAATSKWFQTPVCNVILFIDHWYTVAHKTHSLFTQQPQQYTKLPNVDGTNHISGIVLVWQRLILPFGCCYLKWPLSNWFHNQDSLCITCLLICIMYLAQHNQHNFNHYPNNIRWKFGIEAPCCSLSSQPTIGCHSREHSNMNVPLTWRPPTLF